MDAVDEIKKQPRTRGDGGLYKRAGSRYWYVRFVDQSGRPRCESTKTADARKALRFLERRRAQVDANLLVPTTRAKVKDLVELVFDDYRDQLRKTLKDTRIRWTKHLAPAFAEVRASNLCGSKLLDKYVRDRHAEGASNASVNRELAILKRGYKLARMQNPPLVREIPLFPHLAEDNIRVGFIEDENYWKLRAHSGEMWWRALVVAGRAWGWREESLLRVKVRQVNLLRREVRLHVGSTKNKRGPLGAMSEELYLLMCELVRSKAPNDFLFTRPDGGPVRDFRHTWWAACVANGLGRMICLDCAPAIPNGERCGKCGDKGVKAVKAKKRLSVCAECAPSMTKGRCAKCGGKHQKFVGTSSTTCEEHFAAMVGATISPSLR